VIEISARRVVGSPIGLLSIAASEKGICSIDILSARSKLKDFSELRKAQEHVDLASKQLNEYFSGKLRRFSVPLDLHGTSFQQKVWQQIAKIEYGQTLSYGKLAKAIRNPAASRAVGGAVGANPIPIIIPCHRVMGSTGKLTGYSGGNGIPTKKKLLALEGISFK
jgi:methylated-DNA-[protein]-cysteine S-methyltransferase